MYFIKIEMHDANGNMVPKTDLGKEYGSKCDEVVAYASKLHHAHGIFASGNITNNPGLGGGYLLSSPDQLFKMTNAGVYSMKFEIQLIHARFFGGSWTNFSSDVIHFSPINLKIQKK
jgi:hypothetical protein